MESQYWLSESRVMHNDSRRSRVTKKRLVAIDFTPFQAQYYQTVISTGTARAWGTCPTGRADLHSATPLPVGWRTKQIKTPLPASALTASQHGKAAFLKTAKCTNRIVLMKKRILMQYRQIQIVYQKNLQRME